MYSPVPRSEICDSLIHIRDLYRQLKPRNDRDLRAHEQRETSIRYLLSNLERTSNHPTLKTVLEIREICGLTLEGAHRLFGYELEQIRACDLQLNGGRTHIVESYPFGRDQRIDLPARLASHEALTRDRALREVVTEWQTSVPIKTVEEKPWSQPGVFYVHVGLEDSLGSSIPPGATALVEPIDQDEALRPNPRRIYLLQFGNGYRCSHCVATQGRLHLFSSGRAYLGREAFSFPGSVRVAGRIRMFAMSLPVPQNSSLTVLPRSERGADLLLPWEHPSRDRLLATKHKRFRRSKEQEEFVRDFLRTKLHGNLSQRSERRYRYPTLSEPHIDALLHLTLSHAARYTDALRAGGSIRSDRGRFSLESLLAVERMEDLLDQSRSTRSPAPADVWDELRKQWVEWPPLLSIAFPHLSQWDERIIRLAEGFAIDGLEPPIAPGSWILVEQPRESPDPRREGSKSGWSRPLYTIRREMKQILGYLTREGDQYALLSNGEAKTVFGTGEMTDSLKRIAGVAVPV